MVITPRHELEELLIYPYGHDYPIIELLSAVMKTIVDTPVIGETTEIPLQAETANTKIHSGTGKKITCPNLKTLGFHLGTTLYLYKGHRQRVIQQVRTLCTEIMEGRSRAGHPLDRCCIWGVGKGPEDDPSLVLITSKEGIIVNGEL